MSGAALDLDTIEGRVKIHKHGAPIDRRTAEQVLVRIDLPALVAEVRRLQGELAALRENTAGVLRDLEWAVRDPETLEGECPACHASEDSEHAADCSLVAVLATIPVSE